MSKSLLFINKEICFSIEQLRSYFNHELRAGSTIYEDLLSYGRNGVISKWLCEQGENSIANRVDNIATTLSDSDYIKSLWVAICGITSFDNSLKHPIDKCLQYIDSEINVSQNLVSIQFKVLKEVNEEYTISVSSRLGVYPTNINLSGKSVDSTIIVNIPVDKADEIDWLSITSGNHEFHNSYRYPRTVYVRINNIWINMLESRDCYYSSISFLVWMALMPFEPYVASLQKKGIFVTRYDWKYVFTGQLNSTVYLDALDSRSFDRRRDLVYTFLNIIKNATNLDFEIDPNIDYEDESSLVYIRIKKEKILNAMRKLNSSILRFIPDSPFGVYFSDGTEMSKDDAILYIKKRLIITDHPSYCGVVENEKALLEYRKDLDLFLKLHQTDSNIT